MRINRHIRPPFLLLAVLVCLFWYFFPAPARLVYDKYSLQEWLDDSTQMAEDAVQHIGTNAIPTLLKLVREKDSPAQTRWIAFIKKLRIFQPPRPATVRNDQALFGFRALGPVASNAVPDLVHVYNETISLESQTAALHSLVAVAPDIGPITASVFLNALTNTDPELRWAATDAIETIPANSRPAVFIPALITTLQNHTLDRFLYNGLRPKPINVRSAEILASYGPEAQAAIPELIKLLNDSDSQVRESATNALKQIEPQAAAKAGIK